MPSLTDEIRDVLRQAHAHLRSAHPQLALLDIVDEDSANRGQASVAIDETPIAEDTRPRTASATLHLATTVFAHALPKLTDRLRRQCIADAPEVAATALNLVIITRMAGAAQEEMSRAVARTASAHREELKRYSRDLHDVAAPGVALALQNLDLHDVYRKTDPQRSAQKLAAAKTGLREAISTIRGLSAQSRESVDRNGIAYALKQYLSQVGDGISWRVDVVGDPTIIGRTALEELFLVLREAVRNAIRHASPHSVDVTVRVLGTHLEATVSDDGVGFDPTLLRKSSNLGMAAMRERINLLGGHLVVTSSPGHGTTVACAVPAEGAATRRYPGCTCVVNT